jgi:hypothetical protein
VISRDSGSQQHPVTGTADWYTRREGVIRGPFSREVVTRYILLGRIRLTDQLSTDCRIWLEAGRVSGMVPEVMNRLTDQDEFREYLVARTQADERVAERRRNSCTNCGKCRQERRQHTDRRNALSTPGIVAPVPSVSGTKRRHPERLRNILFTVLLAALLLVWFFPASA